MRLEPVLLVAPSAQPAVMPTRRAFLLASGSLLLGAAAGGACGYSLGSTRVSVPATPADEEAATEPSTGDAMLDELRRLAVKAPIEELVQRGVFFVTSLNRSYTNDQVLWTGVDRLARELVRNEKIADRRLLARFIAQMIESGPEAHVRPLRSLREALLGIR